MVTSQIANNIPLAISKWWIASPSSLEQKELEVQQKRSHPFCIPSPLRSTEIMPVFNIKYICGEGRLFSRVYPKNMLCFLVSFSLDNDDLMISKPKKIVEQNPSTPSTQWAPCGFWDVSGTFQCWYSPAWSSRPAPQCGPADDGRQGDPPAPALVAGCLQRKPRRCPTSIWPRCRAGCDWNVKDLKLGFKSQNQHVIWIDMNVICEMNRNEGCICWIMSL